jgi:hypothetical protein
MTSIEKIGSLTLKLIRYSVGYTERYIRYVSTQIIWAVKEANRVYVSRIVPLNLSLGPRLALIFLVGISYAAFLLLLACRGVIRSL